MAKKSNQISLKNAIIMGGGAFFISYIFSLASEWSFRVIPFVLSFVLLLVIILIGVIFDAIGMSSATAKEQELHSLASQKVPGAKQAVYLVKNAENVSSFCNDVIGDVCGTIAGALGASIVIELIKLDLGINALLISVTLTSLIAALTVGGKAIGKGLAINKGTQIIFIIGKILNKFNFSR